MSCSKASFGGLDDQHQVPISVKRSTVEISLTKTDLGPAAKALVEKIASATGTLYAPLRTIFQAFAAVTADKIKGEGQIDIAQ
jgi:hypothetical protein